MRNLLTLMFLSLALVVLTANQVLACGSEDSHHTEQYHHAQQSSDETAPSADACCDTSDGCDGQSSGHSCPSHEGDGCHCPGCCVVTHSPAVLLVPELTAVSLCVLGAYGHCQAFYFAEHIPEAVYLPIWQPPQWGG